MLIRKYGITLEEYNQMLIDQEGKCLICNKHYTKFESNLSVDHNHKTGEIRGLLCKNCNVGLGFFEDNCNLLLNAINYLNNGED